MFAMPQLRLIFLSLFVSSVLLPMEVPRNNPRPNTNKGSYSSINTQNNLNEKYERSVKSTSLKSKPPLVLPMQNPSKIEKPENHIDIRLENIFLDAPDKVKDIVEHLKDPSYFNLGCWRAAYFLGKPAVGKTTLAKAVAYKLGKEWDCKFFSCRDVREKNRGNTAFKLNDFLEGIVKAKGKCIVICDEMNRLFENADDPHYDTGENSDTFWTFLDSIENNHNFFFIGTANRLDMLSEQLESRIEGDIIPIEGANTTADRKRILLNKFNEYSQKLHDECDDTYLDGFLEPLHGWQGRNFQKLMMASVRFAKKDNRENSKFLIMQKHLESARDDIIHQRTEYIKVGQKAETTEQRQERQHRESKDLQREGLNQAKQFHDENKAQTANNRKEDRDKQNKDAAEQAFYNLTMKGTDKSEQVNFSVGSSGIGIGISSTKQKVENKDYETAKNSLPDEQKKPFEDAQARFAAAQTQSQQNQIDKKIQEDIRTMGLVCTGSLVVAAIGAGPVLAAAPIIIIGSVGTKIVQENCIIQ